MRLMVLSVVCAVIVVSTSLAQQQQQGEQTAEQRFKNIQVFKGLPATQLDTTMAFISGSLGVKCNHCHVATGFDKDDKKAKQTARRMIQMVQDLNKGTFNTQGAVTCFTCHRGKTAPVSVPVVGQNLWAPVAASPTVEPPLPAVKEILDRYVQALGGAEVHTKVTTRFTKGSRIGADGVLVPEEVYQKAPDKLLTITSYPNAVFSNGYNGTTAWGHSSRDGATPLPSQIAEQMKRESVFYKELKLSEIYSSLKVVGKVAIDNAEAYVVEATPANGTPEKLFFDIRSGLLVRRYTESDTALGKLPLQMDLKDYRAVDGIKQPFMIEWSMPGRIWGRKIDEVKQNVPVDDAKFDPKPH